MTQVRKVLEWDDILRNTDLGKNAIWEMEKKEDYLETLTDLTDESKRVKAYSLAKIGNYEDMIKTSVLDWTFGEIEDFLRFLDAKTQSSLSTSFSTLKDYAGYCNSLNIKENDSSIISNFFADSVLFESGNIKNFVNSRKQNELVLSYNEYMKIIRNKDEYANAHKMIALLLWHGVIKNSCDDIFWAEKSAIDIENKMIMTYGRNDDGHEWNTLCDEEVDLINRFYEEQKELFIPYKNAMWAGVRTTISSIEEKYYLCSDKSKKIFHEPVGYTRGGGSKNPGGSILGTPECSPLAFVGGRARSMIKDIQTIEGNTVLRPMNIVKSGVYHRMIKKFGLTQEDVKQSGFKKEWREYAEKYIRPVYFELKIAIKKNSSDM